MSIGASECLLLSVGSGVLSRLSHGGHGLVTNHEAYVSLCGDSVVFETTTTLLMAMGRLGRTKFSVA